MQKIVITKHSENKMLWEYLMIIFPEKTKSLIKKEINKGNIKVNSNKVYDNYKLKTGDILNIFIQMNIPKMWYIKCRVKPNIFYEDENIIILNKPKGFLSQEDIKEKIKTMNNVVKKYCYDSHHWDGFDLEYEPTLINRIDQNTEGLLIASKNKSTTKFLNLSTTKHLITKKYLTIVHGNTKSKNFVLKDYIKKSEQKNKMIVSKKMLEHSKPIETKIKNLYSNNKYSILEVEIVSGKKHQIRAHLAFHNLAIVGDYKYQVRGYSHKNQYQILISNEIIFNLNDKYSYLNDINFKNFNLKKNKDYIRFLKNNNCY